MAYFPSFSNLTGRFLIPVNVPSYPSDKEGLTATNHLYPSSKQVTMIHTLAEGAFVTNIYASDCFTLQIPWRFWTFNYRLYFGMFMKRRIIMRNSYRRLSFTLSEYIMSTISNHANVYAYWFQKPNVRTVRYNSEGDVITTYNIAHQVTRLNL